MTARLALGTVQFGLPYGITNTHGQVSVSEAQAIVDYALGHGVTLFDTAALYGGAEAALGDALGARSAAVVSKTVHGPLAKVKAGWAHTREALHGRPLHGLLAHRVDDLLAPRRGTMLWKWMSACRDAGEVGRIGASVYTPEEVDALLDRYPLQIVQLPFNLLDHRMRDSGALRRLKAAGAEIHVRSAFLQGLLLSNPNTLPASHHALAPMLRQFDEFCTQHGLTRAEAALGYLRRQREVDYIVVGVTSLGELQELIAAFSRPDLPHEWPTLSCEDVDLIDPRKWH